MLLEHIKIETKTPVWLWKVSWTQVFGKKVQEFGYIFMYEEITVCICVYKFYKYFLPFAGTLILLFLD